MKNENLITEEELESIRLYLIENIHLGYSIKNYYYSDELQILNLINQDCIDYKNYYEGWIEPSLIPTFLLYKHFYYILKSKKYDDNKNVLKKFFGNSDLMPKY